MREFTDGPTASHRLHRHRRGRAHCAHLCEQQLPLASYLEIQYILASETHRLCGALVGASLGFLWYNGDPAEVFMAIGSLSLVERSASSLSSSSKKYALFCRRVFVIEALSVIFQVGF